MSSIIISFSSLKIFSVEYPAVAFEFFLLYKNKKFTGMNRDKSKTDG